MFAGGLVEEVRGLLAKYGTLSRTAMQAVGYREVVELLSEQGTASLADCVERVKARTRQFARRQETWFRALSECTFVPMQAETNAASAAERIIEHSSGKGST